MLYALPCAGSPLLLLAAGVTAGEPLLRATGSAPTASIGDFADEGDPYRLSLGVGWPLRPDLSLFADGVGSYIDVNDFEGAEGGITYGIGLDLSLRWLRPLSEGIGLYMEGGGGLQQTFPDSFVAPGTHFNFTILAGAGVHQELSSDWALTIGLRYIHMSNANLLPDNNGYDGVSLLGGVERFF